MIKLSKDNACIAIAIKDGKKYPVVIIEPYCIYHIFPNDPTSVEYEEFSSFLVDEPHTFDEYDNVYSPAKNEWSEYIKGLVKEMWGKTNE